jgi:hypothetical protein
VLALPGLTNQQQNPPGAATPATTQRRSTMHVQVITGDGQQGETNRLRHLKELKEWFNESGKIVHAEAYDPAGLIAILEVRAVSDKEILVLECSRDQIQAVLEWQSATDEVVEFENLLLHLVRKQNPTGESQ